MPDQRFTVDVTPYTRRQALRATQLLGRPDGPPSLTELGRELCLTKAGVLRILRAALRLGLVEHRDEGVRHWYPAQQPACGTCGRPAA